ncbi:MAG: hypothetical protein M3Y17_01765 [Actinomycetota bacterium]|nr:hypothetical protein [Actinomycetota bacterium]
MVGAQAQLFPNWRHYAALTNRKSLAVLEASDRDHANIELEIRDLIDQGLAHGPLGQAAITGVPVIAVPDITQPVPELQIARVLS